MNFSTLPSRSGRPAIPAVHANFRGSKESIVGRNGEINAGSTKELMSRLVDLASMVAQGDVAMHEEVASTPAEQKRARQEAVTAGYYSAQGSREWATLGAAVSADLVETADRDGFMRRLLTRVEVAQGTVPRIRVKQKNVVAIMAASAVENRPTMLRDKYLVPSEFYIKYNMRVEERELAQGSGDILEDKFYETQEGIMVQEDRKFVSLLDETIGIANELQILAGGLSPATLQAMRGQILRWNLPAQTLLFASDVLDDIVGQGAGTFGGYFDPVSQLEIVQTGMIGTLFGMQVMTDAYRNPTLKVLNQGDIYVMSNPEMLGAYTDRGPVQSQEVNSYADGSPSRGWNFYELISMVVHNARGVVKGVRS